LKSRRARRVLVRVQVQNLSNIGYAKGRRTDISLAGSAELEKKQNHRNQERGVVKGCSAWVLEAKTYLWGNGKNIGGSRFSRKGKKPPRRYNTVGSF